MRQAIPPYHGLSPEVEILLACVRRELDPVQTERIKTLLHQPLDWEFIARRTNEQQIRSFMFVMLDNLAPDAAPEEFMLMLQEFYDLNLRRNLALLNECLNVLRLFAESRIVAIPLKGPLQAFRLFGNLALREIADLDILIHKEDLEKAKVLLFSQGYKPRRNLTATQEKVYLNNNKDYDYPFRHASRDLEIELHWHVLPNHSSFGMESELIWDQVNEIAINRQPVRTLSAELLFLLVAIHNEKHHWRGLKYLCDAARLMETQSLDWENIFQQAAQLDREHSVLLTACLSHHLLGAPLAPFIAERIAASGPALAGDAALARARIMRSGFHLPWFPEWKVCLQHDQDNNSRPPSGRKIASGHFGAYVRAIMTPEYIDRVLFPAMPRPLRFLYRITRVLRFMSYHTGVHLPKKKRRKPAPTQLPTT